MLAVPAPLHASMAIEVMNAGKHAYVEKPLGYEQPRSGENDCFGGGKWSAANGWASPSVPSNLLWPYARLWNQVKWVPYNIFIPIV